MQIFFLIAKLKQRISISQHFNLLKIIFSCLWNFQVNHTHFECLSLPNSIHAEVALVLPNWPVALYLEVSCQRRLMVITQEKNTTFISVVTRWKLNVQSMSQVDYIKTLCKKKEFFSFKQKIYVLMVVCLATTHTSTFNFSFQGPC